MRVRTLWAECDGADSVAAVQQFEPGGVHGNAVVTSRSSDGGLTWSNPFTTTTGGDLDKNMIVCDNTASGPFYGTATRSGTTAERATGCR